MSPLSDLPDYRHQDAPVSQRFGRIAARPVVMEVKNLGMVYDSAKGPVAALNDISFAVRRREFITVIGASGCGKSTLIRILAGLEAQTSGEVLLDGKPVHAPGSDRGMVFQSYTLFPWLTVRQNVMFGLKMKGYSSTKAGAEAKLWVDMVGLSQFMDHYPHELSGGMKQRVAIARALANQPRVLLMDEPFGALDAQTRCQMQGYLLEIWKNVDVTIIFITHDLDEAIYLADRIIVLEARPGRIAEIIEVPVARPRHVEQLLEPKFLATRKRLDELIHPRAASHLEPLPVFRMTVVGDDVE
ncbi:MAG: ABC transporter ATP-binding protein [Burkholderiales bacterium]|nr:ABC transporter ATP-binding protein [Phycisphaerae bacterium]